MCAGLRKVKFIEGLKLLCVPGLNCSSSRGAVGSCPIVVQDGQPRSINFLSRRFVFLIVDFGIFQDVLYVAGCFLTAPRFCFIRFHSPNWKNFRDPFCFFCIKYLLLIFFVILFPSLVNPLGMGNPASVASVPAGLYLEESRLFRSR